MAVHLVALADSGLYGTSFTIVCKYVDLVDVYMYYYTKLSVSITWEL